MRVGCDVEIFWFTFKQNVANSAADEKGFVASTVESMEDFQRALR